jgi:hypothetical protein
LSDVERVRRWRRDRPENFSTYTPREVVRQLKVVAAIRDVPLWAIVTDALQQYLKRYERQHGPLPELAPPPGEQTPAKG